MIVPFVPPRPTQLVGRERELATLHDALDAALADELGRWC